MLAGNYRRRLQLQAPTGNRSTTLTGTNRSVGACSSSICYYGIQVSRSSLDSLYYSSSIYSGRCYWLTHSPPSALININCCRLRRRRSSSCCCCILLFLTTHQYLPTDSSVEITNYRNMHITCIRYAQILFILHLLHRSTTMRIVRPNDVSAAVISTGKTFRPGKLLAIKCFWSNILRLAVLIDYI